MRVRTTLATALTGLALTVGFGSTAFAQSYGYRDRVYERSDRYDRDDRRDSRREIQAERIVRDAYRDILRREPDRSGLRQYTRAMLNDGWSAQDVRRSLSRSDEYQRRFGRRGGYRR